MPRISAHNILIINTNWSALDDFPLKNSYVHNYKWRWALFSVLIHVHWALAETMTNDTLWTTKSNESEWSPILKIHSAEAFYHIWLKWCWTMCACVYVCEWTFSYFAYFIRKIRIHWSWTVCHSFLNHIRKPTIRMRYAYIYIESHFNNIHFSFGN